MEHSDSATSSQETLWQRILVAAFMVSLMFFIVVVMSYLLLFVLIRFLN